MNTGEVYFALRGAGLDPETVSSELGVLPTRVLRKGFANAKISSWEVSSGKVSSEVVDVYDLSETVVSRLNSKAETIRRIVASTKSEAVLQVVLTISMNEQLSTPAIGFSEAVVQFVAQAGAYIDVDTYRGAS